MNMKKHSLFFMAALALLTTGCSVYQPQVVDIPLIDHAGETSVNASAGISMWYTPTVGVTASHGFNDWLAGQAFVSYSFSSAHTHVAAGYYKRLGEKARLECYGGMGFGGYWPDKTTDDLAQDTTEHYDFTLKGHYLLPFVQVNFGWRDLANKHIDIGFGLKTGAYLPDFVYHRFSYEGAWLPEYDEHYTTPNLLLEPQLQIGLGNERFKYTLRLGVAFLSDMLRNDGTKFTYDIFTISNGLVFRF